MTFIWLKNVLFLELTALLWCSCSLFTYYVACTTTAALSPSVSLVTHCLFANTACLQRSNDQMIPCIRTAHALILQWTTEQKKSLILRGWPTFEQSDIMHVLTGMLWPRNNSDNGVTLKRGQIKKIPNCNVCNYQLDNKASIMIKVRPKETKITSGTTA